MRLLITNEKQGKREKILRPSAYRESNGALWDIVLMYVRAEGPLTYGYMGS